MVRAALKRRAPALPLARSAVLCGSRLTYFDGIRMSRMRRSRTFRRCSGRVPALEPASRPCPTAQMDTSLFAGLRWRSIGPNRGGRSQAGAGSASRPLEYYFGATGGGVWKTTDGGITWRPSSDKQLKTSSVGAIADRSLQSRRRLCRHGRDGASRQRHPGRRRLQDDRRRQDVDRGGPREDADDLAHPHPSGQSRHRLRRGAR